MTIEDYIVELSDRLQEQSAESWDKTFMADLSSKINRDVNFTLTTKQSELVTKVIRRNKHLFKNGYLIDSAIESPSYRNPPRETIRLKNEVRASGVSCLSFRFKFDSSLIGKFKAMMSKSDLVSYSPDFKIWTARVTPNNAKVISDIIGEYGFHFDDEVLMVLSRGLETKVPSFSMTEGVFTVKNDNILSSLVMGRKLEPAAQARAICRVADILNSKVSDDIRELASTNTYENYDLGPFTKMLNEASQSALQHCLDNTASCMLISPNSYDALSVALCDAYLKGSTGSTLIMISEHDIGSSLIDIKSKIGKWLPDSTIYIDDIDSSTSYNDEDYIISTPSAFMNNNTGKSNIKSVIIYNVGRDPSGYQVLPSQFYFLYEFDRVVFVSIDKSSNKYGDQGYISSLLDRFSSSYNPVMMKGNLSIFDKENVISMLSLKNDRYPVLDIMRLFGVHYPEMKNVAFYNSPSHSHNNVVSVEKPRVQRMYASESPKRMATRFIKGSVEERNEILSDHEKNTSWSILKSLTVRDLITEARVQDIRPIVMTRNEELALRIKSTLILPELEEGRDNNLTLARFFYPSPEHVKYKPENKKIFTSNGIIVVNNFIDDIEVLKYCGLMIYCEPFLDKEEFDLQYQLCKSFNIQMAIPCVSDTYEIELAEQGWYK